MNNTKSLILTLALGLCAVGCAVPPDSSVPANLKRKYDAWVSYNKEPSWVQSPLGSWIIEMEQGDPNLSAGTVNEYPFVLMDYTILELDGTFDFYTSADSAKIAGTYSDLNYYGPQITYRGKSSIYVGLEEIVDMLCVGGHARVVVPSWLLTAERYKKPTDYLEKADGSLATRIYDFTLRDRIADLEAWELAQIKEKCPEADSLAPGVYYKQITAPTDTDEHTPEEKIYVNYICRRLSDWRAVDTNIKDSAKVFGLYSVKSTYAPLEITWADRFEDMKMGEKNSDMILGFACAIYNMHINEYGIAYMTSSYGYQADGSGEKIPSYCPLAFEITVVEKPE